MTPPDPATPTWPRPYWQPGGGDVMVVLFAFGRFAPELVLPAGRYHSRGLPMEVEIHRYAHAALKQWDGYPLGGQLGELLREDRPHAFDAALQAPEVLALRGTLRDPSSLDYLRDIVGAVRALLDVGAVAIADPQILSLFDRAAWDQRFMAEGGAPPRHHVLVLRGEDDQAPGRVWVHTRGMRKFGRPDLSVRAVPPEQAEQAGALCEKLVDMQALGARIQDGQILDVDGLDGELRVMAGGHLEDPRFNNTHLELHWPV